MAAKRMKVSKCPSDALTMTNRAVVNPGDFDKKVFKDLSPKFYIVYISPALILMSEQALGSTLCSP